MNEETTNLTEDTIKFWNENAKPALSWIADRWMECYELSAGWTVGVTVVGGLYVLAKILPDSDDNPTAAAPTAAAPTAAPKAARKVSAPAMAKKTRWNYALTLADPSAWRGAGMICPSGTVEASNYSEAMNLVHNKYANNRLRDNRHKMVIAEVSESYVKTRSFAENR